MFTFITILKIWSIIENTFPKKIQYRLRHLYFNTRYLLFLGKSYFCPICNTYYRKFLPFSKESNIACPKDDSLDRHREIWLFLKYKTALFSNNLKVLHFAPEYCLQKRFKTMTNLNYVSADLDSSEAMIQMDITNILFQDNTFDVILCNQVLEHIVDDRKAMEELFRVLRPEGWCLINIPIDLKREKTYENKNITNPRIREELFGQEDHVRIYGRDFIKRLEKTGFDVKRVDSFLKSLSREKIEKLSLNIRVKLFFCIKPAF